MFWTYQNSDEDQEPDLNVGEDLNQLGELEVGILNAGLVD